VGVSRAESRIKISESWSSSKLESAKVQENRHFWGCGITVTPLFNFATLREKPQRGCWVDRLLGRNRPLQNKTSGSVLPTPISSAAFTDLQQALADLKPAARAVVERWLRERRLAARDIAIRELAQHPRDQQ
jgi:hypothetical protein